MLAYPWEGMLEASLETLQGCQTAMAGPLMPGREFLSFREAVEILIPFNKIHILLCASEAFQNCSIIDPDKSQYQCEWSNI